MSADHIYRVTCPMCGNIKAVAVEDHMPPGVPLAIIECRLCRLTLRQRPAMNPYLAPWAKQAAIMDEAKRKLVANWKRLSFDRTAKTQ